LGVYAALGYMMLGWLALLLATLCVVAALGLFTRNPLLSVLFVPACLFMSQLRTLWAPGRLPPGVHIQRRGGTELY
jgi:hypothetical protein